MDGQFKIEICANSVASCINARAAGAHRVELCAGIPEGGTTPSYGTMLKARRCLEDTGLHVIIRPRGGDFLYSEDELEQMLLDIESARRIGADGVVFGCLTAEGDIDMDANMRLCDASKGMSITFHRAFDMCRDPKQALEQIIALGCDRILTSGGQPTAEKGIPLIGQLISQAQGRIIIMPGCGVNAGNIARIARETAAREFHFSARTSVESRMTYRNPAVSMGGTVCIDEYKTDITDIGLVKSAIKAMENL